MAPPPLRPENALKRADELISVGQRPAALQSLYDYLTARRIRWAQPSAIEPIVFRFLELGVELKRGRFIKDGLHQYKKLVQGSPEGLVSVGAVARKYIDYVEIKMASEQAKAEELQKEEDDDLEGGVTPENLLISAYQQDQSVGGFNDEAVTSWLKFTWESYRAVLDLLRNNSHLEITYSGVVSRSMQFCLKYNRKNEFKRLAEMLRQHLDAANYQQSKSGNNIVDLSDDATLQRYLEQRFHLVNVCVKLELWHEAFKSIEDVYHLMKMSKKQPKPSTLANYYENLAKVFYISGNQALHTAAWQKFYKLYLTNKNAKEEDLQRYASIVMLSALAIQPDYLPTVGYDPQMRLNRLLNFDSKPSKKESLEAALEDDVYSRVDSEVKELYELLEVNYNVSTVKEELASLLPKLTSKGYFAEYATSLRDLIIRKVFVSASQEKDVINIEELYQMATLPAPLELTYWDLEKALLQAAIEDYVSFQIDHDANTVTFVKDPFDAFSSSTAIPEEEEQVEGEETEEKAVEDEVDHDEGEETEVGEDNENEEAAAEPEPVVTRNAYIRRALISLSSALYETDSFKEAFYLDKVRIARENLITQTQEVIDNTKRISEERAKKSQERKQEYLASAALNAEQDVELRQKRIMEERASIEARMEEEAQRRLVEKKKRELEALKLREVKNFIDEVNKKGQVYIDPEEAKNMEIRDARKIIVEQLSKDQQELDERMNFALKKLDHFERALRKVELPLLKKEADSLKDVDMGKYEAMKQKILEKAKAEHQARLADHDRLIQAFGDYEKLTQRLRGQHDEKFGKVREENRAKFEAAKNARIQEIRQQRYEELVAQRKHELHLKEREELVQKQAELTKKQDEVARKQREMEESAARRPASTTTSAPSGRTDPFGRAQKSKEDLDRIAARQREMEEAAANRQTGSTASAPSGRTDPFGRAHKSKEDMDRIAARQREMEEAAANRQAGSTTSAPSVRTDPFGRAQKSKEDLDRIAARQREMEEAAAKKQTSSAGPRTDPFGRVQKSKEDMDRIAARQREMEEAAAKKQAGGSTPQPAAAAGGNKPMSFAEKMKAKRAAAQGN